MSDELLDLEEFKERVQDDTELLLELFDIYITDYEVKRQALGEAFKNKDYDQIKSIAHSLKGASGNISAKTMRQIFMKIEEMGKAGNISGAEGALSELDKTYDALKIRIEQLKGELKK